MSLSSTTSRVSYAGNGVTTAFSFPYKFLADADLKVYIRNTTTGVETLKTLTTHYTVAGEGEDAGGTVTMLAAPATGETVVIYRDPAMTQEVDLVENDPIPAEVVEEAFDLAHMLVQRQSNRVDRSVRLSDGFSPTFDPTLPVDLDDAGDKVMLINSAGTGFADVEDWPTVDDIADAEENAVAAAASASAAAASASSASTSATNAATSETNAAASAVAAQAAVNSVFFRDVVFITSANSPYTIDSTHRGKLIDIDCSGGAVTINLPAISGLDLLTAFVVGFKKSDSGTNAVTINRNGTDTIDGSTSKVISYQNAGYILTPDTDPSPDRWVAAQMGVPGASSIQTNMIQDEAVTQAKVAVGVKAAVEGPGPIQNYSFSFSVNSNALTITCNDAAGNTPSVSSPVRIPFRHGTATNGTYVERTVTGALSLTISSGSTGGNISAKDWPNYVYFVDNSGTVVLGWAGSNIFDENSLQSSTAEGGAGGADSVNVLYTASAVTSKPIRLACQFISNQTTAGTWAAVPTEVSLHPVATNFRYARYMYQEANGYGSTDNKIRRFQTSNLASDASGLLTVINTAANGLAVTINRRCYASFSYTENLGSSDNFGISLNASPTTNIGSITDSGRLAYGNTSGNDIANSCAWAGVLQPGDVVRPHGAGNGGGSAAARVQFYFHAYEV